MKNRSKINLRAVPGGPWRLLAANTEKDRGEYVFWDPLGAVYGTSWDRLGGLLGPFWRSWRPLGPSWAVEKSMSKSIKNLMSLEIGFCSDLSGFWDRKWIQVGTKMRSNL